jgi:hypothetical protein
VYNRRLARVGAGVRTERVIVLASALLWLWLSSLALLVGAEIDGTRQG